MQKADNAVNQKVTLVSKERMLHGHAFIADRTV